MPIGELIKRKEDEWLRTDTRGERCDKRREKMGSLEKNKKGDKWKTPLIAKTSDIRREGSTKNSRKNSREMYD